MSTVTEACSCFRMYRTLLCCTVNMIILYCYVNVRFREVDRFHEETITIIHPSYQSNKSQFRLFMLGRPRSDPNHFSVTPTGFIGDTFLFYRHAIATRLVPLMF